MSSYNYCKASTPILDFNLVVSFSFAVTPCTMLDSQRFVRCNAISLRSVFLISHSSSNETVLTTPTDRDESESWSQATQRAR